MGTSQDLFVQGLSLSIFALLQVTGSLEDRTKRWKETGLSQIQGAAFLGVYVSFPRGPPYTPFSSCRVIGIPTQLLGGCGTSTLGMKQTPSPPMATLEIETSLIRVVYQIIILSDCRTQVGFPFPFFHPSCPLLPYQVVLGPSYIRVVWPQLPLIDGQCPLVIAFHSLILALVLAQ